MTKIINVIFLFLFSFSLIHGENLTDKYREMMNAKTNNVQSKPSTQETIAPPATPLGNLIDSIKEIKKLKQGTFESTTDFNTRRDDKISQLQNTIKPFAKKGSKDYSAGSANMKSYDADNEIMTLTLLWNNEIKSIFPKAKEIKTVLMNISRADAKELFAKEKTHNFHIKITYKGDKLTISSMWINDKYELRKKQIQKEKVHSNNSSVKTDNIIKHTSADKPISLKYSRAKTISSNYKKYKVVNVASNDTLNVRKAPYAEYNNKVGELLPYAKNIKINRCKLNHKKVEWCYIEHYQNNYNLQGWVISRCLAPQDPIYKTRNSYKVVHIRSDDTLSVRNGPGVRYYKIGDLPYYAKGIKVGDCRYVNKNGKWCMVEYGNLRGWASKKFLRKQ